MASARVLKMTMRLTLRLAAAFIVLQPNLLWPATKIDESSLIGLIDNANIWAFDLSPDGETIALLVVAGSKVGAPLWLVTEDIAAKRVIVSRELGASVFPMGNFAPQILYANDRRYLIVQDLQTIRVFDSKSLKSLRTISPPSSKEPLTPLFITGAGNRDVFVCAFGMEQKLNPRFHTTPVQLEIVDISSGEHLGEWAAEDVPQSISPDGDLIAISSLQTHQGVLPLNVFDISGRKVAELTGGFSFKGQIDQPKPLGRVMGLFVGSQELLLTSDGNIDPTGHESGGSMELVSLQGGRVQVQESIKLRRFASTGEMSISADHRTVVAISWYVPSRILAHEHERIPASYSPEMLVLDKGADVKMDSAFSINGFGLRVGGWLENIRPRLSSDGSVIAIAQDAGVTVLTRTRP